MNWCRGCCWCWCWCCILLVRLFQSLLSLLAITSLHSGNSWAYSLKACLFWLRADGISVSFCMLLPIHPVYRSAFSRTHFNVYPRKPPNCTMYSDSDSVLSLMFPLLKVYFQHSINNCLSKWKLDA